ncbi:MAG: glucosaminidase domain-containing protein [Rhodospirillales bacterium]|nr:glucosaminidase domain-containing protein [Rhodospirillales bacterium]
MKKFDYCALGLMGVLVIGLISSAVRSPIAGVTLAPRAALDGSAWAPIAPRLAALPVPDAGAIVPVSAVVPSAKPLIPTVKIVSTQFALIGYDLGAVLKGEGRVPRVLLASIPTDIKDIRETKVRKSIFFRTVLPLVLQVNEEIAADRERLWKIRVNRALGNRTGAIDRLWLSMVSEKYSVERGDLDELFARIDVVPPSLALAQAAEESGWGTSRFVREGNAIFGQWTFKKAQSLKPKDRDAGKTHRVRAFDSLLDSVRAYVRNLNTHRAYREFRKERAAMRRDGKPVNGVELAKTLTSYSERGQDYVTTLRRIMGVNTLHKLDSARLRDEPSI